MSKEKERLEGIREKIRTTNPNITDELLDLLYEYMITKHTNDAIKYLDSSDVQSVLNYVLNPLKIRERNN